MASLNVAKQQLRSAMKQKLGAVTNDLAQSQSRQRSMFFCRLIPLLYPLGNTRKNIHKCVRACVCESVRAHTLVEC